MASLSRSVWRSPRCNGRRHGVVVDEPRPLSVATTHRAHTSAIDRTVTRLGDTSAASRRYLGAAALWSAGAPVTSNRNRAAVSAWPACFQAETAASTPPPRLTDETKAVTKPALHRLQHPPARENPGMLHEKGMGRTLTRDGSWGRTLTRDGSGGWVLGGGSGGW